MTGKVSMWKAKDMTLTCVLLFLLLFFFTISPPSLSSLLSFHPYTPSLTPSTCSLPLFPPMVPLVPPSRPFAAFIFKSTECSTLLKKNEKKERNEDLNRHCNKESLCPSINLIKQYLLLFDERACSFLCRKERTMP